MRDMTALPQPWDLGTLLSGVTAAWRSFDLAKLKSRSGRWHASPKGSARVGDGKMLWIRRELSSPFPIRSLARPILSYGERTTA